MHKYFDKKFNKEIIYISPGEYYATDKDMIIQTLLGSCISVCLFSDFSDFAGMNHFMLPESTDENRFVQTDSGRYGMFAMELLIGEFTKRGISAKQLKAKVFGGGNVIDFNRQNDGVASNNIKFIIKFLDKENIPMLSSHLGGSNARKILFFPRTKKVLLKEITDIEKRKAIKEESKYQKTIIKEEKKSNIIMLN